MDDMNMTNQIPGWLTPVAWTFLAAAVSSAIAIAIDIYARRTRRDAVADELVWVASALYLGPLALVLYARHIRASSSDIGRKPVVAGLPGGSASAVAHVIGVPLVVASGLTIAGIDLWVMIIVIGAVAIVLLVGYERQSASTRNTRRTLATATAIAVVTVLAFDIGMGGWMLLLHFNEFMPPADEVTFWFLMQIGVVLGLVTGYPAVSWLAGRRGGAALI